MDVEKYKRRLLDLEKQLSDRTTREHAEARDQVPDSPGDSGDASVAEEGESESLAEADLDAATLQQGRDALQRIDDGTFGRGGVDGGPIEEKRLEALPWTPYCLEHQAQRETAAPPPPTM